VASQAGRVGEDGSGAMWIAPELVRSTPSLRECSQAGHAVALPLTFEKLELSAAETMVETPRGTIFAWNPATGELGFTGTIPASVFTDLEAVALAGGMLDGRCKAPHSPR
jgi:hypothetical protein